MPLRRLSRISRRYLMVASCLGSAVSWAQVAPNPAVVQREQAVRPQVPAGGALKLSLPAEPDATADSAPVLSLEGVRLLGNKVIPVAELQPLIDPVLGRKVSYADLRKVTSEIEALYRRRGYLLCRAILPEQEVKDGVIALVIVEGYVGESQVGPGGVPKALAGQLGRYVSPVLAQRPLRADLIERQLLLAEDISGISLESVLSKGAVLGSSRLTVAAETRGREVTFGADNYLQRSLGEGRAFLDVRLNEFEDAVRQWYFSASVALPEPEGLTFYAAGLRQPLGDDGWMMTLGVSRADTLTKPTDIGGGNTGRVDGASTSLTASLVYPLVRSRQFSVFASATIEAQDSSSWLVASAGSSTLISRDALRLLRIKAEAVRAAPGSSTVASVQASASLSRAASASSSNPSAPSDFSHYRFSVVDRRLLPADVLVTSRIEASWAPSSLPVPEQFAVGGATLVRSFRSASAYGDRGLGAGLDLATPPLAYGVAPFVFGDYAVTRSGLTKAYQRFGSYGGGFRREASAAGTRLTFEVGAALPWRNDQSPAATGGGAVNYFASLQTRF